jgi:hypothetical protein
MTTWSVYINSSAFRRTFIGALVLSGLTGSAMSAAIPIGLVVKVEQPRKNEWQLLRNGQPYYIRGGGGQEQMKLFAELGGNSIRTWGIGDLEEKDAQGRDLLDRAQDLGLTVAAGIWVGHPRHGFDYSNKAEIEKQRNQVREIVRRYKDRPALLVWGIGNEMETEQKPEDYPQIFQEINELARIVKEEDPDHPVVTTIVGADPVKIRTVMEYCPLLDILGINAYGSAKTVPQKIQAAGWKGPYILTEFGPNGPWERPKTSWGAPIEPTPLEKIEMYENAYKINTASPQCLGTYAFRWGAKQECTATWFGLLLSTGEKTPPVDYLVRGWTGKWPENRSPVIESIRSDFEKQEIRADSNHTLRINATDRDGDQLIPEAWVMKEADETRIGGDVERVPDRVNGCFEPVDSGNHTFKAPSVPGNYRAFVKVSDAKGGACIYSFPFRVK